MLSSCCVVFRSHVNLDYDSYITKQNVELQYSTLNAKFLIHSAVLPCAWLMLGFQLSAFLTSFNNHLILMFHECWLPYPFVHQGSKGIVALMHRINSGLLQYGYYITDYSFQQLLLSQYATMHMLYYSSIVNTVAMHMLYHSSIVYRSMH